MAYDKKYKRRHAARRFGRLRLKRGSAAFPESGGILMYQQEYERWLAAELEDKDLKPELLSIQGIDAEIQDRFAVELEFGTAGLRGVLGAGTNRMNIYMVRKATQGLANYLNKQGGKKSVAISYDSRIKSDVFAREAARVLAGNGVKAYLYKELMPVPALSFATRHLHCDAGIMVTASHNPAKYNGYKAYGNDGCQVTEGMADGIMAEIEALDIFADVKKIPFEEALASGKAEYIGEETVNAFIDAVYGVSILGKPADNLKLVYTPLNGSGKMCVLRILDRIGVKDITVVPEQSEPDGNFPTCPYPNPEIREALQKGLDLCKTVKPDLLLATDPDCDRVGIAVNQHGEYVLMTGNEVGILLLNFIAQCKTELGTMPKDPVAVTTIVSTDMVNGIAKDYGIEIRRTLTGFKYIGDQIALLESEGHPERYLLGFEESYGYLSGPHVRDKDAVNAVLLICEAAAWYAKKGMTLGDAIDALYAEFGCFCNAQKSFTFAGETGMEKMASLMSGLRTHPLQSVAGLPVEGFTDYEQDGTGLPKANVLEYRLPGGAKLIIRPSGTEPKIKAYLSAVKPTVEEATRQLDSLAAAAAELLA